MSLNNLLSFQEAVGKLLEIFGGSEDFKKEYHRRCIQTQTIVEQELGKSLGSISFRGPLGEKGVAAMKELKKWVSENYKFPQE